MKRTTTIIIGAGQCGLAMSRHLTRRSIDHVILERGEIGNSWRKERWDTLTLLTPNWQTRLPDYRYSGDDPDGYSSAAEVVGMLSGYARLIEAPVEERTTVTSVEPVYGGYLVTTDRDRWFCRTLVIASGACNLATTPALAEEIPSAIQSLTPMSYRNPGQVADGGVLVVGASATGVQLADELQRAGRKVTIAVGEHVRAPRLYRGRDVKWWMDAAGVLDTRLDQVDDLNRARGVPSLQLAGRADRATLDLNHLSALGVEVTGRIAGMRDGRALFSGSLANHCAMADLKMNRLLDLFDNWASAEGLDGEVDAPHRFAPTCTGAPPRLEIDLTSGEIGTVIWATGYRPDYSWLHLPVRDRKGRIRHQGGVVEGVSGLYIMGLPFLRRRKSTLIDGADADAADLSGHLEGYLAGYARAA